MARKKKPTKQAIAMAQKAAERKSRGLYRCVVYIPDDERERLSFYVETRLGGEYRPKPR